jgi:protein-S-isoprenylcysteine O-methyltransferase Ste14
MKDLYLYEFAAHNFVSHGESDLQPFHSKDVSTCPQCLHYFMPHPHIVSALELRVPPVAVALCVAGGMWLVSVALPSAAFAFPWRAEVAGALALLGIVIALAGVAAFHRARTTVNPTTPHTSSTVVASGIYRWSRNPMYVGFLLVLIGWVVYLSSLVSAMMVPLFVMYMNRFQIQPEERALATKFGAEYTEYMQRVRRWV